MRNPNFILLSIGLMLIMRFGGAAGEIKGGFERQDHLFPSRRGCKLVRESCIYRAYCTDVFDIDYQSTHIMYYNNECEFVIHNFGDVFLPIHILYRGVNPKPFRSNDQYSQNYYNGRLQLRSPNVFVQSADFSNNGYHFMPNIEDFINLITLNMSHNALTVATLSNSQNSISLQEIDFSFNSVETIDVQSEEHPYKELQVLNLSYNNLTIIPEAIFYHFTKLRKLDISHNSITTISSMAFFALKQMLVLNLANNHITSLSQSLAKLYTLKELYLPENNISVIQYSDINSLQSLNTVDLSSNNIESIEQGVFNNMSQLNFLNLKNNHLQSLEINMFSNCNKLENVDLSENRITKLPIYLFKNNNISHFSIAENNIEGSLVKGMFEGLKYVEKLDLSFQRITSIDDECFLGVDNIKELLLNNNQISTLKKYSFKLLTKLIRLDLSHNFIYNFTLNTEDLLNLEYLSLCRNEIAHIETIQLQFLKKLEFLDVSGNKIIDIEPNSFSQLPYLKVLLISNNHLEGSLSQDTFNGLQAVPELDLSYSFLTAISNGSFNGMRHLRSINVSHCSIYNISYNAFINTDNLDTLDLSYNKLTHFNINTTDIKMLKTLILRANVIQTLQHNLFDKMVQLQTLDLSRNSLVTLGKDVFNGLSNLEFLDVSNNCNLTVGFEIIKPLQKLKALQLSGTKVNITFDSQNNSLLKELVMSNAGIKKLTNLNLIKLFQLPHLVLSHNEISDLAGSIANLSYLHTLDLSFNKIKSLQPGSFIGCSNLNVLNISHNLVANINYGAFYGLSTLNVLDVSYNLLENLEDEKFYQMHSLEKLIVDYNKISYVTVEQFLGARLKILSIGGNPLPCKALIKLKHGNDSYPFQITAMVHDKSNEHNYNGVSCVDSNSKVYNTDYKKDNNIGNDGDIQILTDIRNILKDLTINNVKHDDFESLSSIINKAQNSSTRDELNNIVTILRSLSNKTLEREEIKMKNDRSILTLLEKILKVIIAQNYVATPLPLNNTSNNTEYSKDSKELENNFVLEKDRMISELDDKISVLIKKIESKTDSNSKSPIFTEVCTGLILTILVCLCCIIGFYVYRFQLISVGQRSSSRRQITVDMDNSNL
ncbi:slit homolog 2 protein-like isoform X3 [Aricia agestis]|uniref:slit homolog 2 protein-like isoform X3 n=1 Tax=Aricia agestis TaxID=91739 RepID=UPI001C207E49|nr:slit homolog 2 protein-like isoform X3 [Aricia agestis]XP_041984790.1 slit homolog 2 protein-like isoform X3 [Aricia agestis]